jgi:hypothetical protein
LFQVIKLGPRRALNQAIFANAVLVRIRRAVHEIQFSGSFNVPSSINDRASSPNRTTPVLAQFTRKEFVQIRNYREAPKDGISVKSKISWRNKRRAAR